MKIPFIVFLFCLVSSGLAQTSKKLVLTVELPEKGLCAYMVEFDVQLTKDNQVIVTHDSSVDRTTSGKGKVSELTFDEIRKLDAGGWKATDFAASVKQLKKNGIRVNYYGTDSPEVLKILFETGADFPLVNDIAHTTRIA